MLETFHGDSEELVILFDAKHKMNNVSSLFSVALHTGCDEWSSWGEVLIVLLSHSLFREETHNNTATKSTFVNESIYSLVFPNTNM